MLFRSGDGSIIVFHDSEKAVNNMIPALTKVLEYYTDKGYTFEELGMRNEELGVGGFAHSS